MVPDEISRAAYHGQLAEIREWFAASPPRDPDERDSTPNRWTLLHQCADGGRVATMRFLLDHGADASAADDRGWTPLHICALYGYADAVAILLDGGARVDARNGSGHTPLISAAREGRDAVLKRLLKHGAALGERNTYDETAEATARRWNRPATADLLGRVRAAGGWSGYVRAPRRQLLALRILCEQGRARTDDALLRRLFPAAPPAPEGAKRTREDYRAEQGGVVPRGIFWTIVEYWRSSRDCGRDDGAPGAAPPWAGAPRALEAGEV